MVYDDITSGEITAGKPNNATTWNKVKENFTDHEERINDLEAGVNIQYPPIILRVNGFYSGVTTPKLGIIKTTCNFSMEITGIRLLIDNAGSVGTTEVDVQKSSGGDPYESLLLDLPSVAYTEGDDAISDNATLDATKVSCLAGDILRLDLTSVQTGGEGFLVRIDFERV